MGREILLTDTTAEELVASPAPQRASVLPTAAGVAYGRLRADIIQGMLSPDEKAKGLPFRKENPLHRLYYHDIAPPEKIVPAMRKLSEWLDDPANKHMHVIEKVASLHSKFMAIFPWAKESGRTIRVASNQLLQEAGYPIAIVHSIDRQRYYESLRNDHLGLTSLYLEAVQTTAETEMRVYDEAQKGPTKRRSKKQSGANGG